MLFQLPSGNCIEISVEYYLSMSDDELNQFIAMDAGHQRNNPFTTSVLRNGEVRYIRSETVDDGSENIYKDKFQTMQDITFEEKISDLDFFNLDEI